jgi:hypothetical protein
MTTPSPRIGSLLMRNSNGAELCNIAQLHELKSLNGAMQAATILWMYRKDPKINDFPQHEAERVLRKVIYHMRQSVILKRLAEKDAAQFPLAKRPK